MALQYKNVFTALSTSTNPLTFANNADKLKFIFASELANL